MAIFTAATISLLASQAMAHYSQRQYVNFEDANHDAREQIHQEQQYQQIPQYLQQQQGVYGQQVPHGQQYMNKMYNQGYSKLYNQQYVEQQQQYSQQHHQQQVPLGQQQPRSQGVPLSQQGIPLHQQQQMPLYQQQQQIPLYQQKQYLRQQQLYQQPMMQQQNMMGQGLGIGNIYRQQQGCGQVRQQCGVPQHPQQLVCPKAPNDICLKFGKCYVLAFPDGSPVARTHQGEYVKACPQEQQAISFRVCDIMKNCQETGRPVTINELFTLLDETVVQQPQQLNVCSNMLNVKNILQKGWVTTSCGQTGVGRFRVQTEQQQQQSPCSQQQQQHITIPQLNVAIEIPQGIVPFVAKPSCAGDGCTVTLKSVIDNLQTNPTNTCGQTITQDTAHVPAFGTSHVLGNMKQRFFVYEVPCSEQIDQQNVQGHLYNQLPLNLGQTMWNKQNMFMNQTPLMNSVYGSGIYGSQMPYTPNVQNIHPAAQRSYTI